MSNIRSSSQRVLTCSASVFGLYRFINKNISSSISASRTIILSLLSVIIYCKIYCLYIHVLFGFLFESFKIPGNALTIATPFLSFKGITQAYLLKRSITHNKKWIPLLNLLLTAYQPIQAPNIVFKWRINSSFLKICNNWFM